MSTLARATDLIGRPVVTLDTAEDIAEVKDVVFSVGRWDVVGFTLRGRGTLASPNLGQLALEQIRAIGEDAIMIPSASAIGDQVEPLQEAMSDPREVLGNEVLTDAGRSIGTVADLILSLEAPHVDVAGYEVKTDDGRHALVPIPETFGVSGSALVVPAAVEDYVTHDMTGFGGAVEQFREHLRRGGPPPATGSSEREGAIVVPPRESDTGADAVDAPVAEPPDTSDDRIGTGGDA